MTPDENTRALAEVQYRSVIVERTAAEDGRIACALSSEEPVDRWYGREILDHAPGMVDMARTTRGLPLLTDHDTGHQVGRIEDLKLQDHKLRGFLRFSKSTAAQEIRQDVLDGIRTDMSVGYRILEMTLQNQDEHGEGTYRCRWMPLEGSLVPVPADATVGVGRSAPAALPAIAQEEKRPMSESAAVPETPDQKAAAVKLVRDAERERTVVISRLATEHGFTEQVSDWLASDKSADQVRAEILDAKKGTAKPLRVAAAEAVPSVELKGYSLHRAIRAAAQIAEGGEAPADCGREMEVHKALEKTFGAPKHGGIFFPMNAPGPATRAGLDSKTTSTGIELKFIEAGSFIEAFRNSTKVISLGATFMPGLQGNVAFPRQVAAGTATWQAENPGADVSESNLTLDQVTISPKFLMSTTSYSRNLLVQAVIDVEQLVRSDLALITAIAIDNAAIVGTGASNQPKGILSQTGVGSVTLGANGGTVTWNNTVDLERTVEAANALRGSLAYLTTPKQKFVLKTIAQISAATGIPVWFQGEVNGYRAEASTNVPSNLTKGTATTICSAIIFGNWAELLIGNWSAIELVVDPYRLKKQAMIEVTSYAAFDVAVRHGASFAAIVDAL
jgi:HK97 family phage major capsid protein